MALAEFIDDVDSREHTLTVVDREAHDPVMRLLQRMFESENVEVRERSTGAAGPANVVRLEDESGMAIASSELGEVRDRLLMVNSDMYITGTRPLEEVETSEVVANLDDTTFTVSDKSKLLLIHISRQVEALALETGGGVTHSGFQELSRLHDERGTEAAYSRLTRTDVDVHVYGIPDWTEEPDGMTVHDGHTEELRKGWFVVHDGDGDDERKAALVCTEVGPNEYEGFWTFRAALVDEVLAYLEQRYC